MQKYAFIILASLALSACAHAEPPAEAREVVLEKQQTKEAKGYLLIEHGVPTPELMEGLQDYRTTSRELLELYGGKFIIAESENLETVEGDWEPPFIIVIEFPTYENARKFFYSDGYQRILPGRQEVFKNSKSILVKGRAPSN